MEQVLLLNKSFEPIKVINWKRALCMIALGKVEVIEEYDEVIKSARSTINSPAVVRLLSSFKRLKREVSFTKGNIFARDKWTCQYCLKRHHQARLTLDHVFPRSRGGETRWENIVTCCTSCNTKKGNRTPTEACMLLLKTPTKPDWISLFSKTISKDEVPEEWRYFCYL